MESKHPDRSVGAQPSGCRPITTVEEARLFAIPCTKKETAILSLEEAEDVVYTYLQDVVVGRNRVVVDGVVCCCLTHQNPASHAITNSWSAAGRASEEQKLAWRLLEIRRERKENLEKRP